MRRGVGPRADELRLRVSALDATLIQSRNAAKTSLSQLQYLSRRGDTGRTPAEWTRLLDQAAARLEAFDRQIALELLKSEPAAVRTAPAAPGPDPLTTAEARSQLRGRLHLASSLLNGLPLPARTTASVQAAITNAIKRL